MEFWYFEICNKLEMNRAVTLSVGLSLSLFVIESSLLVYYWIVFFTSNIFLLFVFTFSNNHLRSIIGLYFPQQMFLHLSSLLHHLERIIKQNRMIKKSFWTKNWIIKKKSSRTSHFLFTTDVPRHFLVTTLRKQS